MADVARPHRPEDGDPYVDDDEEAAMNQGAGGDEYEGNAYGDDGDLGEYEDGDDDDFDDDDLPPDHPALARVQEALRRQLTQRLAEVQDELQDKTQKLKKSKTEREEVGVQLYSVQQQLAKLQAELEKTQDECNRLLQDREQEEMLLSQVKSKHAERESQLKQQEKEDDAIQREYDELNRKVLLFEKHAEELEAKVKGAKRAAGKASKEQTKLEEEKQKQDEYVDRLRERVKELEREITLTKKQLEAQKEETEEARGNLREAQMEIDEIALRKREVQQLWQHSITGLGKRNEALSAMQKAVREQQQEVFARQRELEGVERNIKSEQETNEGLSLQLARLETEVQSVNKKINALVAQQDEVKAEYSMVNKALQDTERQLSKAEQEANVRAGEVRMARDKQDRLAKQKVALEEELVGLMQEKLTVDNASKGAAKEIKKIRDAVAEQEMLLSDIENKAAQDDIKASDYEARIDDLKKQRSALDKQAQDLDEQLRQHEADSKKHFVAIERKQAQIDNMNKKIGALRERLAAEGAGNEDMSPAEIEIANLRKDITGVSKENGGLQDTWLSKQSELVSVERELDQQRSEIDALRTKRIVLQEQQFRLEQDLESQQKEIKGQEKQFKSLQQELVKLNTLIARNRGVQEDLQSTNVLMQNEFTRQLKAEEKETVQLQTQIEDLHSERERLLNAVIEAERQLLLWEKKIQLVKETKAEINSNEGKEELDSMRTEIHRMSLKLQSVLREKEELITEMERCVDRRGNIGAKARIQAKKGTSQTQTIRKEVVDLKKRIKTAISDIRLCESEIDLKQKRQDEVQQALQERQERFMGLRSQLEETADTKRQKLRQRMHNLEDVVEAQGLLKHFQGITKGSLRPRFKDVSSYDRSIDKQMTTLQHLGSIIDYLVREHPHLEDSFASVRDTLAFKLNKFRRATAHMQGSGDDDDDASIADTSTSAGTSSRVQQQ